MNVNISWLVALGACAATTGAGPASLAVAPKRPAVALEVVRAAAAADTLVTTVTWTVPGNDGKGPLDSLTVNVANLGAGGVFHAVLPVTATAYVVRQPLPFQDATWDVTAQVCTWRGSRSSCATARSAFAYALAAPPPVGGLAVGNVQAP